VKPYEPAFRKVVVAPITDVNEWSDIEIVQLDLPSGLRTYWYTRLSRYEWRGHLQVAFSAYMDRRIRFQRSNTLSADWIPIDSMHRRIPLVVPQVEIAILCPNPGSQVISTRGKGILTGQLNRPKGFTGIESTHDEHPVSTQIRASILEAYRQRFGDLDDKALMRKIRQVHRATMFRLYGITDYKYKEM
jgi:hypothetical protein